MVSSFRGLYLPEQLLLYTVVPNGDLSGVLHHPADLRVTDTIKFLHKLQLPGQRAAADRAVIGVDSDLQSPVQKFSQRIIPGALHRLCLEIADRAQLNADILLPAEPFE